MIPYYTIIDRVATGNNIRRLRMERGISVRELQEYIGLDEPRAIYQWQSGQRLASISHLYALSYFFDVPIERIVVCTKAKLLISGTAEQIQQIEICHLIWNNTSQAFIPCKPSAAPIIGIFL